LRSLAHVGDIRQCGFMVGIELVQDRQTRGSYPLELRVGHLVAKSCRAQGLLLRPLGNILVLVPPLSTRPRELTKMVAILHRAIVETTEGPNTPL
jgi:Adenosylmethionine-8-amino-7-oxononanoate aminotransferase